MYVCICNAITERQVRECAKGGACTLDDLAAALGIGAGCGRCRGCADQVLKDLREGASRRLDAQPG
jgi:bacterioferritin-associated ferredoxin